MESALARSSRIDPTLTARQIQAEVGGSAIDVSLSTVKRTLRRKGRVAHRPLKAPMLTASRKKFARLGGNNTEPGMLHNGRRSCSRMKKWSASTQQDITLFAEEVTHPYETVIPQHIGHFVWKWCFGDAFPLMDHGPSLQLKEHWTHQAICRLCGPCLLYTSPSPRD